MWLRRISTKWVVTVFAAVCIPFLGLAWYIDTQTSEHQWEVVRHYLLTMARDLAKELDNELGERAKDIEIQAAEPITVLTVEGMGGDEVLYNIELGKSLNRFILSNAAHSSAVYDLILAVNSEGGLVRSSTVWPDGTEFTEEERSALSLRDYSTEPWFRAALKKQPGDRFQAVFVDHHKSDLLPGRVAVKVPHPENYHVGIAVGVRDPIDPALIVGVVYALARWDRIQTNIKKPQSVLLSDGSPGPDDEPDSPSSSIYKTSYAWIWMADADTIIAHPNTGLYTAKVSGPPINLPQLVQAAKSASHGYYPEYVFQGKRKNAAYYHCAGPDEGGLGWIVGMGIDNDDVTSFVEGLQSVLVKATLFVLAIVLLLTVLVARRTTAPILELQRHTQRIASGDLDARLVVTSQDELGDLGRAFNQMTHELAQNRERLIKAEKDAAWREMARQVAHEIKNPLTPIALSAALLKRAKDERSPEFDSIFERTIELVTRQVEHMRRIAADFSAFAGLQQRRPEALELGSVIDDVLAEVAAWAAAAHVEVERRPGGAEVVADRSELSRVFLNLISNSIEAMPQGGRIRIDVQGAQLQGRPAVRIEVRDTGVGLSDTVRARLFEPYFTTRTHGTGLGLAITARLVDDMNGTIELENVAEAEGRGTIARVTLPVRSPQA